MKKGLFLLVSLLFLFSCAIQKAPDGGPRDETPPEVLKVIPENLSTNFKSKKIEITFDEYVSLNNLQKELIISPTLENFPKIQTKGKKIVIEIEDTLRENTTYIFQFGNSIVDLTEGNPLSNYNYAFSTGTYIDSLQFFGTLKDAFTNESIKDIKVLLYDTGNDSAIFNEKPTYFTKASDNGSFKFNYLRPGTYDLFALGDKNNNYIYDLGEKVAFYEKNLILPFDSSKIEMKLFEEIKEGLIVNDFEISEYGKLTVKYSNTPDSIVPYIEKNGIFEVAKNFEIGSDSVYVWFQPNDEERRIFAIEINNDQFDTLNTKNVIFGAPKTEFKILNDLQKSGKMYLTVNQPIKTFNHDKINVYSDTILTALEFNISLIHGEQLKYELDFAFEEGKKYNILLNDSFANNIFGGFSDSTGFEIAIKKPEEVSNLTFEYEHKTEYPIIIQLLDPKDKILREQSLMKNAIIEYKALMPGGYKLRMIHDKNSNGKWDTGELYNKKPPEKVEYFEKPLSLKANWELTEKLSIKED